jgi:hypothetical protein
MRLFATKTRKILTGIGFLSFLAVAGLGIYQRHNRDCCAPGAACCYPGSPCCHGHGGVASR